MFRLGASPDPGIRPYSALSFDFSFIARVCTQRGDIFSVNRGVERCTSLQTVLHGDGKEQVMWARKRRKMTRFSVLGVELYFINSEWNLARFIEEDGASMGVFVTNWCTYEFLGGGFV